VVATTTAAGPPGRLGLLDTCTYSTRYLVDTGSVYSLLPHNSSAPADGPALVSADKSPVKCWGSTYVQVCVQNKVFKWRFLLAAVAFPIIGGDFLRHFDLKVDLKRLRLEHGTHAWTVPLAAPPTGSSFAAIGVHPADKNISRPISLPPSTARSSPRQVSHGSSERGEFPTIRGAPDPPQTANSTPKFRAPGKQPKNRLPGNVKALRAVVEREGEYPSSAGSPGPHVKVATPLPAQRATMPAPANPSPPQPPLLQQGTAADTRPTAPTCHSRPDYEAILASFPAVLNPGKELPPVKHHVQHFIETEGNAVASTYRRLDPEKLEAARAEFAALEKQGIIRRSSSHWASPLHMAPKSDGTWRPCGDFRRLNLQTKPDRYTCPNLADLSARLSGCTVFSKLDLRKGYHQVPVNKRDVAKTAVITPFGLFEFLRMPFGLRNAGQTFQRLMDEVLAGLPFVFVYLDDVLIASRSHADHVLHLRAVLERLQQHGLVLNGEKCVLGATRVEYLGHLVTASGIRPLPARVAAIKDFPKPSTVKELQTFLGMLNFYRRFIAGAAGLLRPLTDALRAGKGVKLQWTDQMELAFATSKQKLSEVADLAHPSHGAALVLAVDASNTHVGAVLQQVERQGQSPRPLGFFSKKLDKAQTNYSAFDRELLALYLGIRHFRWALEGRRFSVQTDHKPLTFALHRLSDAWSARQQRQLSYVAEFTSTIEHVPGKTNVVADALSRPPPSVASQVVATLGTPCNSQLSLEGIARGQLECEETMTFADRPDVQKLQCGQLELLCMNTGGQLRPLVPQQLRRRVFKSVHELAHAGVTATRRMISSRYAWPGCASDVQAWVRDCTGCALGKPGSVEKGIPETIPIPDLHFSHVHVDIVGPLPTSQAGQRYVLTMIDRSTRWPEAVPLSGITAQEVADQFVSTWVSRFGVPETVTTDKGTQFSGSVWQCLCEKLGIRHIMTTAYHPQSNGIIERFHRQLKEGIRARGGGSSWTSHLPFVLLGIRAAPKQEANTSAAKAVFGGELNLPGHQRPPEAADLRAERPTIPSTMRTCPSTSEENSQIGPGHFVFVKKGAVAAPLESTFSGPFLVLRRLPRAACLQMGQRQEWVSVDRLKLHRGPPPSVPACPPRRGRPAGRSSRD